MSVPCSKTWNNLEQIAKDRLFYVPAFRCRDRQSDDRNLKLVQKLLGHSNLNTTAEVYTHTSADAGRSAALALEEAIYGDLF